MTSREAAFPLRRNIALYYGYIFLMQSGLWLGIWIKYLIDGRGLELKWILAMDMPFWLAVAVMQAPFGALADHIGRRRILALGAGLYALTILGFGFTTNYWMLFADYMLWALAMSAFSGADQALLFDSMKAAGRQSEFQHVLGRGYAVQLTAALIGITGGGFFAEMTSLAFTVQVSALFPLLAAGAALLMAEAPLERTERAYWRSLGGGFSFAWRHPQVRYTLLVGAVLMTGTFGPVVLIQPFLLNHNVETALFGLIQAPIRVVSVVSALSAGYVAMRVARTPLVTAGCAAVILSYLGLAAVDSTGAFAFFAAPAIAQAIVQPAIGAHLNERIPSERRATVLSLMQLAFSLQVAFFEPTLGLFADDVSLTAAFVFAAIYCGLLMPPLVLLWRRAHPGGIGVPVPVAVLETVPGPGG